MNRSVSYRPFSKPEALLVIAALLVFGASCSAESKPPEHAQRQESMVVFTDVTQEAGLGEFRHENGAVGNKWYPEMMGSGGGFLDYDGDGWLDILLLGGGDWDPARKTRALWLYRNNGDGTFTDQTEAAGLSNVEAYTIGMAAADYDNDGDEDFVVSNLGEDMLFQNDGGVFTEVGKSAGIAGGDEWGSSPIFFDADRDGHLDLFIGNYVRWSPESDKWCPEGSPVKLYCIPADYDGIASRYYHNNGDGTFTDRTAEAGFITGAREVREKALGVIELDFNQDGWSDLYVATDGEGNLLYENNRDGTFTERGVLSGVAFSEHGEARAGMGVDAGVVDSSGQISIMVGNFSEEPISVYRHLGGGLFQDRTAASRMSQPSFLTLTFGLFLFDVDLDGDLDLFAANGHVYPDRLEAQDKITFRQPAQLYLNSGDGTFSEVRPHGGVLTHRMVARGAAYGDFDRDGDLDILITENAGPVHLWRNDLSGGNFLRVQLEGSESNRDALGTRVIATLGDYRMERRVRTGSSYLSQSEKVAVFGLGSSRKVDSLIVYWPNGRVHRFGAVDANTEIRIVEADGAIQQVPMNPGAGI
ncbi:MAG TPA: CRTAC1 family protein [Rhodothermales bacterium]|nr:CRTAC1 family protein [Rhodothermales bacterium]